MIRPALAIAVSLVATSAMAREFTAADLRTIEHINQERNAMPMPAGLRRADPVCSIYAVNKAHDLTTAGYGPGEVAIAVVTTERGELHAVAEVRGTLKGRPTTIVLDNRHEWTAPRSDLEAAGYTWREEFTR